MSQLILTKQTSATIATPAAGKAVLFIDTDGSTKVKDESASFTILGSVVTSLESSANTGTIAAEDYVVLNPTATAAWNLPTAVGRTKPLYILNRSAFQITFDGNGSETINGDLTSVFLAGYPYTSQILIPIGGNWYVY